MRFWWKNKNLIKIADTSFKYLDDKKSFFKVKQKAFFIIFKRLSVAKNSVRPESALLKKLCKIRELKRHLRNFQGFILLDFITYINFFPQSMTVILPWEEVFFYRPYRVSNKWDKLFKNEQSKIRGRKPLKNYIWSTLEYFVPNFPSWASCLTSWLINFRILCNTM